MVILWNYKIDTYSVRGLFDANTNCASNQPVITYELI